MVDCQRIKHFYLFILVTFLIAVIPHSAVSIAGIRSVPIQRLPQSFLSSHFPKRSAAHVANTLYELTSSKKLISLSGQQHDISAVLSSKPRIIHPNEKMTVSLDGVRISNHPKRPTLVHTDEKSAASVHVSSTGNILAIHLPSHGLSLMPVDSKKHANLFYSLDTGTTAAHISFTLSSRIGGSMALQTRQLSGKSCSDNSDLNAKAVNMAIGFDSKYCSKFSTSSDAIASITSLISEASKPFESSSCLRLKLGHVDARCDPSNDPYMSLREDDGVGILDGFMKSWTEDPDRQSIKRDLAYLVTGNDDGSSSAGKAYIGVVCSMRNGFGFSEGNSVKVLSHEVGHTLNAQHDGDGLMQAFLGPNVIAEFSSDSMRQIIEFVDQKANCLQPADGTTPAESQSTSPTTMPSESAFLKGFPLNSPVPIHSMEMLPIQSMSMMPRASASMIPMMTPDPTKTPEPSLKIMFTTPHMTETPKATTKTDDEGEDEIDFEEEDDDDDVNGDDDGDDDEDQDGHGHGHDNVEDHEDVNDKNDDDDDDDEDGKNHRQLTMAPMPSYVPDTPTLPGSCANLFSPRSQLSCYQFTKIGDMSSSIGSVQVYVRQQYGKSEIRLVATEELMAKVSLMRVDMAFLFLNRKLLGKTYNRNFDGEDGKGSVDVSITVDPADLKVSPVVTTCCEESVSLSISASVRREHHNIFDRRSRFGDGFDGEVRSADVSGTFDYALVCVDPCLDLNGDADMTDTMCPMCEMA